MSRRCPNFRSRLRCGKATLTIKRAKTAKASIPPVVDLPPLAQQPKNAVTLVKFANETILATARALVLEGHRDLVLERHGDLVLERHCALVLKFANGVELTGLLRGATTQEEMHCRTSASSATIFNDPIHDFHRTNTPPASNDWAILSPNVPVFCDDEGMEYDKRCSPRFLTCAPPYAPAIGRWGAEPMLCERIHRFLDVVQADEYDSASLGVWGCGVFANDPLQTAKNFRDSHEGEFAAAFQRTVFGIADWPTQQSYFHQFCDVFSER